MKTFGAAVTLPLIVALAACGAPGEDTVDDGSATATEAKPATGKIAGSLSYPSDYIPADMQVCAEETSSKEVTCKGGFKQSDYELELPAGTYQVYARTDDYGSGYRAYYNEAVKCGLDISCKDRTVIDVVVEGGATVGDIDPADWYAQ